MKSSITLSIFLIFTLSVSSFANDIKLGVVDLERAINEVDEGVKAKTDLKKEFEAKQAILDKKQNETKKLEEEFKKLKDAFDSQASVMKPNIRQEKEMELQKKFVEGQKKGAEVQQLYVTMQQEMVKRQQDVMGAILQKMGIIINMLQKEGGYTMILNRNETAVLAVLSHLDLTNEAIRRYNDTYKSKTTQKKK